MTDAANAETRDRGSPAAGVPIATRAYADLVRRSLNRRRRAERRFRIYGVLAIGIALVSLVVLFTTIFGTGVSAFRQTMLRLDVTITDSMVDPRGARDPADLAGADYRALVRAAIEALVPEATSRADRRDLGAMISVGAGYQLRDLVLADPTVIGRTIALEVPFSDDLDQYAKGFIRADVTESERRVNDKQIRWFEALRDKGRVAFAFNTALFVNGDSREPELAGLWGGVVGSLFTMLVTLALSFPVAVASAIYLEEFAPANRWTTLIEVNINNLAAVPSIIFGLLGLAVFLNFFGLPRSAPLVGGIALSLMTLPTIIIAARAALKSVPPSIREAALGLGASQMQMIFHHVLPLALPGVLTGAIIGMARAVGETAPLLMIGMVAFIVDIPRSFTDPATVLPVQIYLWSDSPERAFVERMGAAIIVLLGFLIAMNIAAVILRRRFERRW